MYSGAEHLVPDYIRGFSKATKEMVKAAQTLESSIGARVVGEEWVLWVSNWLLLLRLWQQFDCLSGWGRGTCPVARVFTCVCVWGRSRAHGKAVDVVQAPIPSD
jgi:hypothetical protein